MNAFIAGLVVLSGYLLDNLLSHKMVYSAENSTLPDKGL